MKILFDGAVFSLQAHGGVSRVMIELFAQLICFDEVNCRAFVGFHKNQYLREAPSAVKKRAVGWYLPPWMVKQALFSPLNRFLFAIYARWFNPDIVHCTYYVIPPVREKVRLVVTVHDMIRELFLKDSKECKYERKSVAVERAHGVICISENTRRDLCRLLPREMENKTTVVIHHGSSLSDISPGPASGEEHHPYLLYVGRRIEPYKNFDVVLRALAMCRNSDLQLICFGGGGFMAEENARIRALGLAGRVHQRGGDDALLCRFYAEAVALVYPSLYEGFGLPPIEAMAHGCPVLASHAPPMPEIISDAGLFFDPADPAQLVDRLSEVQEERVRDRLVRSGYRRAGTFSWRRSAEQTIEFYDSLRCGKIRK